MAFVVLDVTVPAGDRPTEAELIDHCRVGLANYKIPARVGIVDALPVVEGPNGVKVLKSELREWAVELVPGPVVPGPEGRAGRGA